MRIVCVMSTVGRGGALRVLTALMAAWTRRGDEVVLVTQVPVGGEAFPIPDAVHRVGLGLRRDTHSLPEALRANAERVRAIRAELVRHRPDVIVAFENVTNVLTLIAAVGLPTPVVVSERVDPRHHPIGRIWSVLRALSYPRAATVVLQTESLKAWARSLPRPPRVAVIPNPAPAFAARSDAPRIVDGPYVLGMGRLVRQKGFDLLVRAFALVARRHAEHRLVIAGDGDRAPLERLAGELGVGARVHLPGVLDPAVAMRDAEAFVLSSRYEGFPNVLLEAMALGRAVVATRCPSGPDEVITDGADGLLVAPEDPVALAGALDRVLTDAGLRARLGEAARARMASYGLDQIVERWDAVFARALERR
jgi:glycosyltransferase involved in cell wall biosynthesis